MTLVNVVPQVVLNPKTHVSDMGNFLGRSNGLPAPCDNFIASVLVLKFSAFLALDLKILSKSINSFGISEKQLMRINIGLKL